MPNFSREEWLHLENFCRTHPAIKRVLKYICENPDREHTIQSVARESGMAVSFFDLKALFIYKLLSASGAHGQPVSIAWELSETARYRLRPEKLPLIQAVLERREPNWDADGNAIGEESPADAVVVPPSDEEA